MPVARVQMPDGRIARFEVPDGTTPEQVQALASQHPQFGVPPEPNEKPYFPPSDPTEGMSTLDKVAAATAAQVAGTGRGLKQLSSQAINLASGHQYDDWIKDQQQQEAQIRQRDEPLTNSPEGLAGAIIGNTLETTLPGGALRRYGALMKSPAAQEAGRMMLYPKSATDFAAQGAAMGAVQPTVPGESRSLNALEGAGAGAATSKITRGVGALAQPAKPVLNAAQQSILDRSMALGFKPTLSQITGSKGAQIIEAGLGRNPVSAGHFQKVNQQNEQKLVELAGKAVGEDWKSITPEALDRVHERLGMAYDALREVPQVQLDGQFKQSLAGTLAEHTDRSEVLQSPQVKELIAGYMNGGEAITGKRLVADLKALRKQATQAFRAGDSDLGQTKMQVATALEETADRSLANSGESATLENYRAARKNFATLFSIEKAADLSTGKISGPKLATDLRKHGRNFGNRGSDLDTAAQYMSGFRGLPTSGTAEGVMGQVVPAGLASALGALATGNTTGAAVGLGSLYAMPYLGGKAYTSDLMANYARKGIPALQPKSASGKALAEAIMRAIGTAGATAPQVIRQ